MGLQTALRRATIVVVPAVLVGAIALAPGAAVEGTVALDMPPGDPVAAAIAWSQVTYPDGGGGATSALLGRDDDFADNLASGVLQQDVPLLLTGSGALDADVAAELERLGVTDVTIMGGIAAVSQEVEDEVAALVDTVDRIFGETRIETAIAVAESVDSDAAILARAFGGDDPTQGFADSLAAGGWAAADGLPVLLTETEQLTEATAAHLEAAGYETLYVVGGTAAVSQETEDAAAELVGEVVRVAGETRFATAVAVAEARGFASADASPAVLLVDGQDPDSWAGGFAAANLAGLRPAPIVLSNVASDDLPAETQAFLGAATALAGVQGDDVGAICDGTVPDDQCAQAAAALGLTVQPFEGPGGEPGEVDVTIDPATIVSSGGDIVVTITGEFEAVSVAGCNLDEVDVTDQVVDGQVTITLGEQPGGSCQLTITVDGQAFVLPVEVTETPGEGPPLPDVAVQLLAINDFHGQLEPVPSTSSGGRVGQIPAGGAEYLATHIANLEATNANTLVVSAGDLIGASPLSSALFHDEPTILAMNHIGLDINAVGNHEFDEGAAELLRMQNGGCHAVDGCQFRAPFNGADFEFLAANVVSETTGQTLFPAYTVREFDHQRIAFIGMTLEGTPNIVSAAGVAGYDFLDEADTVNALVPEIQQLGIEAIVVLIHEGLAPASTSDIDACAGPAGAIIDIANRMSQEVDLIVSGHTHLPYVCEFNGIPVTSAFSTGRVVTDIDLQIDGPTRDVESIVIDNRIVTRDVPTDPFITTLINESLTQSAPIRNRVIGSITADILRANDPDGSLEQAMGDVIADAQLASTTGAGAVISFMNPGGVRADMLYAASSGGEAPGQITYGELFQVQPFGNAMVTMDLTGAQIDTMLEQQFCGLNSPLNGFFFKVLLPSANFAYTWDASNAAEAASCAGANSVDISTITIGGVPIVAGNTYRVTVNSFLADGGDGFSVLREGTNRVGGDVDTDAFEDYMAAQGPLMPPPLTRITRVP